MTAKDMRFISNQHFHQMYSVVYGERCIRKHTCVSDDITLRVRVSLHLNHLKITLTQQFFLRSSTSLHTFSTKKKSLILEDWKLDSVQFFYVLLLLLLVREVRIHIENKLLNIMKLFACFFSTYQTLLHTTTGDGWMSIWRTTATKTKKKREWNRKVYTEAPKKRKKWRNSRII